MVGTTKFVESTMPPAPVPAMTPANANMTSATTGRAVNSARQQQGTPTVVELYLDNKKFASAVVKALDGKIILR